MPKDAGFQGSTLSDHCMTTGFGPFELPTCGLLYREGGTTPHLKLVFIRGVELSVGFQSIMYEHPVAKQNGGGAELVELYIYNAS